KSPDYTPVIGRSGPGFNPTGMRIVAAATGEAEAAIAGILVEKSQRSASDTPWWWISGDTYPHRDTLKRWGGRWSKRQKRWYFIADELPQAVQQLIEQVNAPSDDDHDPCSVEEAAAVLGLRVKNTPPEAPATSDGPPRLFDLSETVYTRHDLETPDGQPVPTGTRGTVTRLYNRNPTHGWSYDVDFVGIGVGWFFERELTSLEPTPGIRVTRGSVVPPGAVPPPSPMPRSNGHSSKADTSRKQSRPMPNRHRRQTRKQSSPTRRTRKNPKSASSSRCCQTTIPIRSRRRCVRHAPKPFPSYSLHRLRTADATWFASRSRPAVS
ncbi:hypothetical protein HC928_25855, partial [bacterium]|nr:hypothetical protein [bacterium]